jgi:starch phosphorylase
LNVAGSRKVNGVAELHSELLRTTICKDFVEFFGISKFGNVTNGGEYLSTTMSALLKRDPQ